MKKISRWMALSILGILWLPGVAAAQCKVAILGGLAVHDKTASTPVVDPAPLTPGHAVDGIAATWNVDSGGLRINPSSTSEPVADILVYDATGMAGPSFCFNAGNQIVITYSGVESSPSLPANLTLANLDIYDSNDTIGLAITSPTASMVFSGGANGTARTQVTIPVVQTGTAGGTPMFPTDAAAGGTAGAAIRIKNLRFDATALTNGATTISIVPSQSMSVINAGTLASQTVLATTVAGLVRPTIGKQFGAGQIKAGETTTLTFTLNNANTALALNGVAFWDTFPSGLLVANPSGLSGSCGGSVTATPGSNAVFLSGATLASSTTCNITVNVTGVSGGVKNNTVQMLSTTTGWATPGTASLTVVRHRHGQVTSN